MKAESLASSMIGARLLRALLLVAFTISLHAPDASAQCAVNKPGRAKLMKTSLVREHLGCPSDPDFFFPNSQTGTGTPSCAPPLAESDYEFGASGRCTFKMKAFRDELCPLGMGPAAPCMSLELSLDCQDVREPGGDPITNSGGDWNMEIVVRATFDASDNGDMTVIDVPVVLPMGVANGDLTLKHGPELNSSFLTGLPPCTQLEVLSLRVLDPDGGHFATMGSGTRPN